MSVVNTHIDISQLSGNSGGGGEKLDFTSSDGSIGIERDNNTIDIYNNTSYYSSDDSISIERYDNEVDFKNNIEIEIESDVPEVLSVDTSDENKFLLHPYKVEEEYDGYESKLDKLLFDHSFYNIIVLGEMFANAKEANERLMELDTQFYPIQGQMMQYLDMDGEKHIVRYTGSCIIRRDGVRKGWGDVVWDYINKCNVVFVKATTSTLSVAECHGAFWNLHDFDTQYKYWKYIASDPELGVIIYSGNASNVYCVSKDGFETMTIGTARGSYHSKITSYLNENEERRWIDINRSASAAGSNVYWDEIKDNGDVVYDSSTLNSLINNCISQGESLYDVYDADNLLGFKLILWRESTLMNYHISIPTDDGFLMDYVVDDKVTFVKTYINEIESTDSRIVCEICLFMGMNVFEYENAYVIEVIYENGTFTINKETEYLDTHMTMWTEFGIVQLQHKHILIDEVEVQLPVELRYNENMTTMCRNEEDKLMVVTGNHQDNTGESGNYGFLIDLRNKQVINDERWEEVPQIPDGIEGILYAHNNVITQCKLGKDIFFDNDGFLSLNKSDRYTQYESYRLKSEGTQSYESVWCDLPFDELVIGTHVYDSETAPRTDVGSVVQIGNLNNPHTIVVSINGHNESYEFQTSLIPNTIATTKAIIDLHNHIKSEYPIVKFITMINAGGTYQLPLASIELPEIYNLITQNSILFVSVLLITDYVNSYYDTYIPKQSLKTTSVDFVLIIEDTTRIELTISMPRQNPTNYTITTRTL